MLRGIEYVARIVLTAHKKALRQHRGFNRLALLAGVLLCAWQAVSVQHVHASETSEPDCVMCPALQHDDDVCHDGSAVFTHSATTTPAPAASVVTGSAVSFNPHQARAPPVR